MLTKDLYFEIAQYLPALSLVNFSLVNKLFRDLANDQNLWKYYVEKMQWGRLSEVIWMISDRVRNQDHNRKVGRIAL